MEQRDLIKDQADQLGRVLGQILADFMKLKSTGQFTRASVESTRQLKNQLDVDINVLLALKKEEINTYLKQRNIASAHFERLAEYLTEIGKSNLSTDSSSAKIHLKKAVELLELMDDFSEILSFDRLTRKAVVQYWINKCR